MAEIERMLDELIGLAKACVRAQDYETWAVLDNQIRKLKQKILEAYKANVS